MWYDDVMMITGDNIGDSGIGGNGDYMFIKEETYWCAYIRVTFEWSFRAQYYEIWTPLGCDWNMIQRSMQKLFSEQVQFFNQDTIYIHM